MVFYFTRRSVFELLPARYQGKAGCIVAFVLCCLASTTYGEEFQLTDLYGITFEADVQSIDIDGNLTTSGDEHSKAKLAELRSIRRIQPASTPGPKGRKLEVFLVGSGRIVGERVSMDEEDFVIRGHGLFDGPLAVPIDYVRAIVFDAEGVSGVIDESLKTQREDDRFFVRIDDTIEALDGLVEGLTETELSFSWQDETRKLSREDVLAIAIADAGVDAVGDAVVQFADGQALLGSLMSLEDGSLELQLFGSKSHRFPWSKVASVEVRSDRLLYLSEMKPVVAKHKPIVTNERSWKKDRNVHGEPLRLGDVTYSKGIGVASLSYLKYQLDAGYSTFCATIGIDASTEGRGDCVFLVRGDGKELTRHTLKGTDAAKQLRVDLSSADELELIVLPGNDLDLSDHANWCDACLLK